MTLFARGNRKFIIMLLITAYSLVTFSGQREDNMDATAFYGINIPEMIHGSALGKPIDNEASSPGLGVTIPFSSPAFKATVFIYDLGLQSVPEGPMSELVLNHFYQLIKEIESAVEYGVYNYARLTGKYATGSQSRGREILCAEIEIGQGGNSLYSYLYLTGHKDKFVKVRITTPAQQRGAVAARQFADELAMAFWPEGFNLQ